MTASGRGARRTLGWLLVLVQAVLLLALVLVPHRPPSVVGVLVGATIAIAGLALGASSFRALGDALTPTPVPIDGAGLRIDGPYRYVRHPIYTAVLLGASGFTLAVGTWWTLAVTVALTVFFVGKSRWEDRLLAERHGAAWRSWAATTGALVPRPSRASFRRRAAP